MQRSQGFGVVLLGCLLIALACNEDVAGAQVCSSLPEGRIVTFNLTENVTQQGFQIDPCAFDPQVVEQGTCDLMVWDFDGSNTFFQFETGEDPSQCNDGFNSILNHADSRFEFVGNRLRAFDEGSGPFATGTYEERDAAGTVVATGTFEFTE